MLSSFLLDIPFLLMQRYVFSFSWIPCNSSNAAPPSRDILLGYYEAMKASARDYLASLSDTELDKSVVVPPANESRAVSNLRGVLVYDNVVHGGRIAYLRGLYGGMGCTASEGCGEGFQ